MSDTATSISTIMQTTVKQQADAEIMMGLIASLTKQGDATEEISGAAVLAA
jgi:hypothetical protein